MPSSGMPWVRAGEVWRDRRLEVVKCKTPSAAGESGGGHYEIRLAATDSPTGEGSTIGAPGLNDSVRNGKR